MVETSLNGTRRPIGVALTVALMGLLLSALVALAFWSGGGAAGAGVLVTCLAVGRMVLGLWRGERWAWNVFRTLLLVACLLSLILVVVPSHAGRLYHGTRAAVMGLWLWSMCRPNVRAYFGEAPVHGAALPASGPDGSSADI